MFPPFANEVSDTMDTLTLIDGYDRSKTPASAQYRRMTAEEAKRLSAGTHVLFQAVNGKAYRAKVNGAVKTWKRDTARVEVPLKYGLYDYFIARAREDGSMTLLLVPVTAEQQNSGACSNSEGELVAAG